MLGERLHGLDAALRRAGDDRGDRTAVELGEQRAGRWRAGYGRVTISSQSPLPSGRAYGGWHPAHDPGQDLMTTSETRAVPAAEAARSTPDTESADRMAHAAVFVSGFRCIMMYVVLPAAGPVASQYSGIILPVSMLMHAVTIVTATLAVSRAMRSRHPWRRAYAALGASFFLFSLVMLVFEGATLLS
jgi:hypothetical protein